MTQEEKKLLLKDLSARLPYGVKVKLTLSDGTSFEDTLLTYRRLENWLWDNTSHNKLYEGIRPYLRPMSTMTEEENKERIQLGILCAIKGNGNHERIFDGFGNESVDTQLKALDWLNKNHFDYRGLLERGLAIAVTKENNPYN